jgi:hypothetical protein
VSAEPDLRRGRQRRRRYVYGWPPLFAGAVSRLLARLGAQSCAFQVRQFSSSIGRASRLRRSEFGDGLFAFSNSE